MDIHITNSQSENYLREKQKADIRRISDEIGNKVKECRKKTFQANDQTKILARELEMIAFIADKSRNLLQSRTKESMLPRINSPQTQTVLQEIQDTIHR